MSMVKAETREESWGEVLVLQPVKSSFDSRESMDAFQKELLDAIVPTKYILAVVDFSNVTFCNSEVLGTLLRAQKLMRAGKRTLRVACLAGPLDSMFRLCRLDQIIPVTPTVDAAIAAHGAEA